MLKIVAKFKLLAEIWREFGVILSNELQFYPVVFYRFHFCFFIKLKNLTFKIFSKHLFLWISLMYQIKPKMKAQNSRIAESKKPE